MGRLMHWAASAPAVLLAVVSLAWLGLAFFDRHPFWPYVTPNLSEAAATHDAGEVARLLELGQDPNAAYVVRGGLLRGDSEALTPLEAAAEAGSVDIEALLVSAGALRAVGHPSQGSAR